MKRKVFIHNNEDGVPDNDIVVVTTYEPFTPTNNEYHRIVDTYPYQSFVAHFFGMMTFEDTEVHTTWIGTTDDAMFDADLRARNAYAREQAEKMVIA